MRRTTALFASLTLCLGAGALFGATSAPAPAALCYGPSSWDEREFVVVDSGVFCRHSPLHGHHSSSRLHVPTRRQPRIATPTLAAASG